MLAELSLVVLATIYFARASERDVCPDTIRSSKYHLAVHDNKCYMFVNHEKFWDDARAYCWRMGGEMLLVKNAKTMKFIKNELYSPKLGWSNNGVWLGASHLRDNGWEWTTGESLTYSYWADGEPNKFLGFLSLENCACMRRSDDWRWHDYHCHMDFSEFKFICEFPTVAGASATHVEYHSGDRSAMEVKDDTAAVIGIAVGGVVLLLLLAIASVYLYRKHERQKAQAEDEPNALFRNHNYMTVVQDSSQGSDSPSNIRTSLVTPEHETRPTSNIYLDPDEVNRIYEVVTKDTNHGVNVNNNIPTGDVAECTRLVYTGAAGSTGDMEGGYLTAVSMAGSSRTASANNSLTNIKAEDGHYVEMSGGAGVDSGNWSTGATGSSSDLVSVPSDNSKYMNGSAENKKLQRDGASREGSGNSLNNITDAEKRTESLESLGNTYNPLPMKQPNDEVVDHVYNNGTVGVSDMNSRPLPPLP